jgi:hypothetical protein
VKSLLDVPTHSTRYASASRMYLNRSRAETMPVA